VIRRVSKAAVRAVYAKLVEHFHLRPWEIKKLTDRQIVELYFHPRNDKGEVEEVYERPAVPTLKSELFEIDLLYAQGVIKKDNAEQCKEKLRAKWAAKESVNGS
jgi:hypothetical protein